MSKHQRVKSSLNGLRATVSKYKYLHEMRTRGGRVVIELGSIKYLWLECSKGNWRNQECTGLNNEYLEMGITHMCSGCGLVKLYSMKIHIVLKALSSLQAHTDDLRIYVQIAITEQGKLRIWRFYYRRSSDKESSQCITYLNLSESGGMKQWSFCNGNRAIATRQVVIWKLNTE